MRKSPMRLDLVHKALKATHRTDYFAFVKDLEGHLLALL